MLNNSTIDDSFRALGEPTRRAIIEQLSLGPTTASDLARPFDMSLTAVLQHLHVLESCGLVKTEKRGRVRTCSLDIDGLTRLADWVGQRRARVERSLDRLGDILAEPVPTGSSQTTSKGESK